MKSDHLWYCGPLGEILAKRATVVGDHGVGRMARELEVVVRRISQPGVGKVARPLSPR